MLPDSIRTEIVLRLTPLNPGKIILFGSQAGSSWNDERDIDSYIVTRDDFIPENFREKMNSKIKFANALKHLKKKYDFDIIVHTRKMSETFRQRNLLFSHEIFNKGIGLHG
jgi:uncharacterized protein